MLNKLLSYGGVLLSAYGVGAVILSNFVKMDTNSPLWKLQVAFAVLGGLGLHYLSKMDLAKYWPKSVKIDTVTTDYYTNMNELDALTNSFKEHNDRDGLNKCKELHALLFQREYLDIKP